MGGGDEKREGKRSFNPHAHFPPFDNHKSHLNSVGKPQLVYTGLCWSCSKYGIEREMTCLYSTSI